MPFLLPSFDMRYRDTNLCWYKQLDSSWSHFTMTDGFHSSLALRYMPCCPNSTKT
jgi:hypothetical protein